MATTAQRTFIRNLLKEAELDRSRVSLMHTRVPHCERDWIDRPVDVWLSCLTVAQASAVIEWLQREVA